MGAVANIDRGIMILRFRVGLLGVGSVVVLRLSFASFLLSFLFGFLPISLLKRILL